jgi:general secretion pathway protein I
MSRARGFTLLEVLVAAALFALAMTLIVGILSRASRQVRDGGDRAGAAIVAESLLAAPGLDAPLQPGLREGRSTDGRYAWRLDIRPFAGSPLPARSQSRLLQLELQVRWGQGQGQALHWQTLRLARPQREEAP